jgi:3-oxoacyl-(acyl-carrier-protein) synthase
LPPNYNFSGKREHCSDLRYLPSEPLRFDAKTIIANSFAFGGNNSSCLLTKDPKVIERLSAVETPRQRVFLNGASIVHGWGESNAVFQTLSEGRVAPSFEPEFDAVVSTLAEVQLPPEMKPFKRSPKKTQMMIKCLEGLMQNDPGLQRNEGTGLIGGNLLISSTVVEKYMSSVYDGDATQASALYFPMTTLNTTSGVASIAYPIIGYNTTLVGGVAAMAYGHDLIQWDRQKNVIVSASDDLSPLMAQLFRRSHLHGKGRASLFRSRKLNLAEKASSLVMSNHETPDSVEVLYYKSRPIRTGIYRELIEEALATHHLQASDLAFVVSTGGGLDVHAGCEEDALEALFGGHPIVTSVSAGLGYGLSSTATTSHWFAYQCLRRGEVPLVGGLPTKSYTQKCPFTLEDGSLGLVISSDISGIVSTALLQRPSKNAKKEAHAER